MNRRQFLQTSLATAASITLAARAADSPTTSPLTAPATAPSTAPAASDHPATQIITLGPEKIRASRMAMGTGTYGAGYSSNQLRRLGPDGLADLLVHAYDHGITFWDTSDSYGTHSAIKLALKKVPRDKVTILTKTDTLEPAQLKQDLVRFQQELGTDYIDIILLHSRDDGNWDSEDKPLMDILSDAKQKKIVRSLGISIHSLEAMQTAAKSKWLEIAMIRLNPGGIRMDDTPENVLKVANQLKAAGKGIINIKVLGEGQLTDRLDEALTFTLTKSPAHAFSIGNESIEDFNDNFARLQKIGKTLAKNPTTQPNT